MAARTLSRSRLQTFKKFRVSILDVFMKTQELDELLMGFCIIFMDGTIDVLTKVMSFVNLQIHLYKRWSKKCAYKLKFPFSIKAFKYASKFTVSDKI